MDDAIGKCHSCGVSAHVRAFGGFMLCPECHVFASETEQSGKGKVRDGDGDVDSLVDLLYGRGRGDPDA